MAAANWRVCRLQRLLVAHGVALGEERNGTGATFDDRCPLPWD